MIRDGRIETIGARLDGGAGEVLDVAGRLVLPGFVESHIHPDKAFIADRTEGLRAGGPTAQTLVAELKRRFTVDDIYQRARRVLELAVRHGCTTMRAHVEIDAFVELRGVEAMRRLQRDLAEILDLELIAFAQEGIFNDGVTRDLLREGVKMGLRWLGGCPYMDTDQRGHIDWFFETAQELGVPLDFHADFVGRPGAAHLRLHRGAHDHARHAGARDGRPPLHAGRAGARAARGGDREAARGAHSRDQPARDRDAREGAHRRAAHVARRGAPR